MHCRVIHPTLRIIGWCMEYGVYNYGTNHISGFFVNIQTFLLGTRILANYHYQTPHIRARCFNDPTSHTV